MKWTLCTLLLLTTSVYCAEDESNEVVIGSSIKPPVNLDSNLRKALLKALIELENEEKEKLDRTTREEYVNIISHIGNANKNVEKASASAVSYITKLTPVNMTVTVKKTTSKPKHVVVIQKSKGTQHKSTNEKDLDLSQTPEQFIASASTSFSASKLKSEENKKTETSNVGGTKLNSISSNVKSKRTKSEKTTTTVRPTTSTEESEANVESLQFFSAPLVAAFTVHQDEKGLPKRVVPIYNQVGIVSTTTEKQLNESKSQEHRLLQKEVEKQQRELEVRQEEELRKQQKKLEEEIGRLTKLREEQESLLREQKLAFERKLIEQQKKLYEEQTRLLNNIHPFVPITTPAPPIFHPLSQFNNNNFVQKDHSGTLVSIQPSLGFVQPTSSSSLPLNAQILPVKNAIDFRTPLVPIVQTFPQVNVNQPTPLFANQNKVLPFKTPSQHSSTNSITNPFDLRNVAFYQTLPSLQATTSFKPTPPIVQNTFPTAQNLPFVSLQNPSFRIPETTSQSQSHGSRNLRQESGTGNFLNNNNRIPENNPVFPANNRFNTNSFLTRSIEPFRSLTNPNFNQYNTLQYSVDQPFVNQRLNNLLYNSGLGTNRQQEDLNIVSKVLSFNHLGGGDSQFASSNYDDRRLRVPSNWRVV